MANNLSREEEQRGTSRVFMWGTVAAAAIFVALLALFWFGS
ncbi:MULTISPECIES: hypothetical protein [unclassified Mesorhizobium]|nr:MULTISPECIES: hypothetical protein [unclassified Mesorhizobium]WIE90319.1 hypothetical protein P9270_022595 [Mesorhizobium sp. WSM4875]MCT2579316.1 hypothetical protein [Mesorhizobium sp. P13.3]MDF3168510.1 hypothetical protein [Mesorhizobium sp. P16.1]MDF3178109.1 hypothetical protein [Mesorhizobium sp. P17.1]MDF3185423.1 hypothetical protein [Mesorhizobium sp. ICCV3110.1]